MWLQLLFKCWEVGLRYVKKIPFYFLKKADCSFFLFVNYIRFCIFSLGCHDCFIWFLLRPFTQFLLLQLFLLCWLQLRLLPSGFKMVNFISHRSNSFIPMGKCFSLLSQYWYKAHLITCYVWLSLFAFVCLLLLCVSIN